MKNQIILWLCSITIAFLIGYINNVTDKVYPVTGTFGIEGRKVSYKLDKETFDANFYKNIVISDITGIEGKLIWFMDDEQHETKFVEAGRGLEAEIPILKPGKTIKYKLMLAYAGDTFEIPENDFVTLTFWGNIPSPVNILHFIFLYAGLLMSIRCLLELFNQSINLKKLSVMTCALFIGLVTIISPLKNSYKIGAINNYIPSMIDLIEPILVLILSIWIFGTILIFNNKYIHTVTICISFATIVLFFFLG